MCPRPGKAGLVLGATVELTRGAPEDGDRRPSASEIPDARSHHAVGTRHAGHLAQAGDRVRHEVHHELRKGRVVRVVGVGQVLGRGAADIDARLPCEGGFDELLRRVDGRDRFRPEPADKLDRQRPRAAADVECRLPALDAREVGQSGR